MAESVPDFHLIDHALKLSPTFIAGLVRDWPCAMVGKPAKGRLDEGGVQKCRNGQARTLVGAERGGAKLESTISHRGPEVDNGLNWVGDGLLSRAWRPSAEIG